MDKRETGGEGVLQSHEEQLVMCVNVENDASTYTAL